MIVFERGMCRTSQRTGEMMREQKDFQQIAGSTITPKIHILMKYILVKEYTIKGALVRLTSASLHRNLHSFWNPFSRVGFEAPEARLNAIPPLG